jgi:hypothetical protein
MDHNVLRYRLGKRGREFRELLAEAGVEKTPEEATMVLLDMAQDLGDEMDVTETLNEILKNREASIAYLKKAIAERKRRKRESS